MPAIFKDLIWRRMCSIIPERGENHYKFTFAKSGDSSRNCDVIKRTLMHICSTNELKLCGIGYYERKSETQKPKRN